MSKATHKESMVVALDIWQQVGKLGYLTDLVETVQGKWYCVLSRENPEPQTCGSGEGDNACEAIVEAVIDLLHQQRTARRDIQRSLNNADKSVKELEEIVRQNRVTTEGAPNNKGNSGVATLASKLNKQQQTSK